MNPPRDSAPSFRLVALGPTDDRRQVLWQRWWAFRGLAMLAATWPLWTSATGFPQIPWFAALRRVPIWLDPIAAGIVVAALFIVLLGAPWRESCSRPGWWRSLTAVLVAAGGFLLLLDQNRLQPWVWQDCWLLLIVATTRGERALRLIRWLTIGIYFWSALSKFDATFIDVMAPDVVTGLLKALPFGIDASTVARNEFVLWLLPVGEMFVAALLVFPLTRRTGLVASLAMHGVLIAALSRWGLNQQPAVLLWNLYFIGQNLLVFGRDPRQPRTAWRWGVPEVIVALAVALPVLEPLGWLDHWPGWSFYTPGVERVSLMVDPDAIDQIPPELQGFLGPPRWRDGRRVLRLDRWSLATLAAPIYPQGRFRAAVALAVVRRYDLGDAARLIVQSRADRWTGRRRQRIFVGEDEIAEFVAHFWINTTART